MGINVISGFTGKFGATAAVHPVCMAFYMVIPPNLLMVVRAAAAVFGVSAMFTVIMVRLGMSLATIMVVAMPVFLVVAFVCMRFCMYFGRFV
jgi:hypothetical protein